jgi:predicted DNA repair protein MutK
MASGFFVLLDDIATLMNDVATMGKIAGKKTAGILGDDLAVNAEKASGFVSERELPVLWAISKGSMINKLIILPVAFVLSYFLPWSITAILLVGGCYLAYEGVEKILEYFLPHHEESEGKRLIEMTKEEVMEFERARIKSAIITDFILSVEIVIIALGAVINETIGVQIGVVSIIALVATIGVYGIVGLIVRMDDFGFTLVANGIRQNLKSKIRMGRFLIKALPWVIKTIGIIGTIALLLVSGGLFVHNIDLIHDLLHSWPAVLAELTMGIVVGIIMVGIVKLSKWIISKTRKSQGNP